MENMGRVLAELSNDASTHTVVPPSPAQADVVEEQPPSKLQESANKTRVLRPWLGTIGTCEEITLQEA